jgi:hypothetical protein
MDSDGWKKRASLILIALVLFSTSEKFLLKDGNLNVTFVEKFEEHRFNVQMSMQSI